jgi:hypothetical protein
LFSFFFFLFFLFFLLSLIFSLPFYFFKKGPPTSVNNNFTRTKFSTFHQILIESLSRSGGSWNEASNSTLSRGRSFPTLKNRTQL